ncbi:MAG: glycosyltransferase, partial [Chloroflexota bacterium]
NGSKIRILNLIKQIQSTHQVTLLTLTPEEIDRARQEEIGRFCARVHVLVVPKYAPKNTRALVGLFSAMPRSLYATTSLEADRTIRQLAAASDLVVLSELGMLPYVFCADDRPVILDDPELGTIRDRMVNTPSVKERVRHALTWYKLSRFLRRALRRVMACTVVSDGERMHLQRAAPWYRRIRVVPNCLDLKEYASAYGSPRPDTLIFSGALTYSANLQAVQWFLEKVWASVLVHAPHARFVVTGAFNHAQMSVLRQHRGVEFAGYLPDVRPAIAESWISVVPLQTGAGTRLKILEAMALGTPVVSTTKGAEGLAVTPERDILIADSPADFAAQTMRLLRSSALRAELAQNGRQLVRAKYDWDRAGAQFRDLIVEVVQGQFADG